MKLKNYFLIVLGHTDEIFIEIKAISEGDIKFVNGVGLLLVTFESAFSMDELNDFFSNSERSFIIKEITESSFAAHLQNKAYQDHLFSNIPHLRKNTLKLKRKMKLPLDKKESKEPNIDDILDLINKIGYENLDTKSKEILKNFSNL